MKFIIFIITFLLASPALSKDDCTPNLIKEDMCLYAKEIVSEVRKSLPIKMSETAKITSLRSENTRVIATVIFSYNLYELKTVLSRNNISINKMREIGRLHSNNNACSDDTLKSFLNLGGEFQYEYFFNDGSIYDVVTITNCI